LHTVRIKDTMIHYYRRTNGQYEIRRTTATGHVVVAHAYTAMRARRLVKQLNEKARG
jgi:hypothetical protein